MQAIGFQIDECWPNMSGPQELLKSFTSSFQANHHCDASGITELLGCSVISAYAIFRPTCLLPESCNVLISCQHPQSCTYTHCSYPHVTEALQCRDVSMTHLMLISMKNDRWPQGGRRGLSCILACQEFWKQ